MGCVQSADTSEEEKRHQDVEKQLKKDASTKKGDIKVLLLGNCFSIAPQPRLLLTFSS
jgi:hypothetical protein